MPKRKRKESNDLETLAVKSSKNEEMLSSEEASISYPQQDLNHYYSNKYKMNPIGMDKGELGFLNDLDRMKKGKFIYLREEHMPDFTLEIEDGKVILPRGIQYRNAIPYDGMELNFVMMDDGKIYVSEFST